MLNYSHMVGGNSTQPAKSAEHIENIRAKATDALKRFTPEDRQFASEIATRDISVTEIRKVWFEALKPLFTELENTAEKKTVHDYIAKHFQFDADDTASVIDSIIETRQIQAIDESVTRLFRDVNQAGTPQHVRLIDFLLGPIGVIDTFFERHQAYTEAIEMAHKNTITLCDPHGSWLERQRAALQINKERSKVQQNEDDRLVEIAEALAVIHQDESSVLNKIITMDWEFMTVLDLRQKYQKQVDKLSGADQSNPSKLIKIFERVTKNFRENETAKLTSKTATKSLKGIRDIQESVYDLLLEIFDLSDSERNRLLREVQSYVKLRQERDMILLLQRNREHFLSRQ